MHGITPEAGKQDLDRHQFRSAKIGALLKLRNGGADRNGLKLFASISESEMKFGAEPVGLDSVSDCSYSTCAGMRAESLRLRDRWRTVPLPA